MWEYERSLKVLMIIKNIQQKFNSDFTLDIHHIQLNPVVILSVTSHISHYRPCYEASPFIFDPTYWQVIKGKGSKSFCLNKITVLQNATMVKKKKKSKVY